MFWTLMKVSESEIMSGITPLIGRQPSLSTNSLSACIKSEAYWIKKLLSCSHFTRDHSNQIPRGAHLVTHEDFGRNCYAEAFLCIYDLS